MHTTTVRFDEENWHQMKAASRRAGVSVAQYIRDATVARLAVAVHLPELVRLRQDVDHLRAQLAGRRGLDW